MKILSIDTSCDETAAAVTDGITVLSNVVWSQASLHAKFGGVYPSLAKREHEKRIGWVVKKSLSTSAQSLGKNIDAVAVTAGPGLAIALEVGIKKAKEISLKYKIPLITVNHIEGHILSPLAQSKNRFSSTNKIEIKVPSLGIVTSGGHTQLILIKQMGKYEVLASTVDDAIGEALDKAARMLGLGYPGGAVMETIAKRGNINNHVLPIPLVGQEKRMMFSYSGLKTALYRKISEIKLSKNELGKDDVEDLSASFQQVAFSHFIRVLEWMIINNKINGARNIYAGGGVMANLKLRTELRKLARKYSLNLHFPYSKKLYGDNAAMIGVAAYFKAQRGKFEKDLSKVDRSPNAKIDVPFVWE